MTEPPLELEPLITFKEVADATGYTLRWLNEAAKTRRIPCVRPGKTRCMRPAQYQWFLDHYTQPARPARTNGEAA